MRDIARRFNSKKRSRKTTTARVLLCSPPAERWNWDICAENSRKVPEGTMLKQRCMSCFREIRTVQKPVPPLRSSGHSMWFANSASFVYFRTYGDLKGTAAWRTGDFGFRPAGDRRTNRPRRKRGLVAESGLFPLFQSGTGSARDSLPVDPDGKFRRFVLSLGII